VRVENEAAEPSSRVLRAGELEEGISAIRVCRKGRTAPESTTAGGAWGTAPARTARRRRRSRRSARRRRRRQAGPFPSRSPTNAGRARVGSSASRRGASNRPGLLRGQRLELRPRRAVRRKLRSAAGAGVLARAPGDTRTARRLLSPGRRRPPHDRGGTPAGNLPAVHRGGVPDRHGAGGPQPRDGRRSGSRGPPLRAGVPPRRAHGPARGRPRAPSGCVRQEIVGIPSTTTSGKRWLSTR
jgi:hypothetical protein